MRSCIAMRRPPKAMFAHLEAIMIANGPIYTAAIFFLALNVVLFWYGVLMSSNGRADYSLYVSAVARGTGKMLNLDCGLLLLLGSRVFLAALKLPFLDRPSVFDHAMPKAHVGVGYFVLASAVVHSCCHIVPGILNSSWEWGFLHWTYAATTGVVLLSVLIVLVAFSLPRVRILQYELFYAVHLSCAALFLLLITLHGVSFGRLYTYKYTTPFVFIYLFDRLYRRYTETTSFVDISDLASVSFTRDVLKLRVPKPFSYRAGQYAELCFPDISRTQFHPLTIASAPHETHVTFYVKQAGNWTTDLLELMRRRISCEKGQGIAYKIRGPYGSPAQHFGRYRRVVLVSGGIGGTPFLSAVKDYHHNIQSSSPRTLSTPEFEAASTATYTHPDKTSVDRVDAREAEDVRKGRCELGNRSIADVGSSASVSSKALQDNWSSMASKRSLLQPLSQDADLLQNENLSEASEFESDACEAEDVRRGHFARESSSLLDIGLPTSGSSKKLLEDSRSFRSKTRCVEPVSVESGNVSAASALHPTTSTDVLKRHNKHESDSFEEDEEEAKVRYTSLQRLQFLVGSSTLSYATISLAIIRVFVCLLVVLYHRFPENLVASASGSAVQSRFLSFTQTPTPFAVVDMVLCVFIFLHSGFLAFLDIMVNFNEASAWVIGVDAFVVLPLLAQPIVVHSLNFSGVLMRNATGMILFCISWPLALIVVLYRHGFTFKSLDTSCLPTNHREEFTDGLDFLYVTPTSDEDEWLVSELQEWATSPHFRLHRFLTREASDEENSGGPAFTHYGRPDFHEVFDHLVRNVDSGTTVGVFFCGPKPMEIAIREACYRVMGKSRRRGSVHGEKRPVPGCNVKLVVRAENFG